MAKAPERLAVPSAENVRVRLEGALERVELARDGYRSAAALLTGQWRSAAVPHRGALERLRDAAGETDRAEEKLAALKEREGWPESFAPSRALEQLRAARAALAAHLARLLGESPERGVALLLDDALAQILPPVSGRPLLTLRLVGLFGARLDVFPDRLRRQRFFSRDDLPLPRGGIHYAPMEARVRVAGWPSLDFRSVDDASALATLIELLNRRPFDRCGAVRVRPALVLRGSWSEGEQPGALLIAPGTPLVVFDGDPTFDAAIAGSVSWPNPSAPLLLEALLRLPAEAEREVLERLVNQGRARPLGLPALRSVAIGRDGLRLGSLLRADFPPSQRGRVRAAFARFAGSEA